MISSFLLLSFLFLSFLLIDNSSRKLISFFTCFIHPSLYNLTMNAVQAIKQAIHVFLIVAVVISAFQEFDFSSKDTSTQPQVAAPEIPTNGTKVDGLAIITTDKFRKDFKDLLIAKEYSIEIKEFPFEGNEYWINMFLTHGHMLVVFFLVSKYQSEQDQGRKTKWMMLGMLLVFGWMMGSPYLRTQRLGLEYKGQKIYIKDTFDSKEIFSKIEEYEEVSTFGLDPIVPPKPADNADIKFATQSDFQEVTVHEDF